MATSHDLLLGPSPNGQRYELNSPTALPVASGFLWNKRMMVHSTCRGYSTAQFMQPEPAKYSHAPNIEAKTFMQPEQNYYAHHPGRFVYIKDEDTNELFSAPYEPVRGKLDRFNFSHGQSDLQWTVEKLGIRVEMTLTLTVDEAVELWSVKVINVSGRPRHISVYPHFSIGYMSWMNQGASYREDLGGVVGTSVTPYQKPEDWPKQKDFKDKTYFLCEKPPVAWEARQSAFEGEGGLHAPSSILEAPRLSNSDAIYETPTAVVQYSEQFGPGEEQEYRFIFGPAKTDDEIREMRKAWLSAESFASAARDYHGYVTAGAGCLRIETPDKDLDNFVNNWLPRQVYYHGVTNRLSTDPQTRNYMQDNMGMAYIDPDVCRESIITALSQQKEDGSMPDGILLAAGATLKYINQIPHTDHCVWLPVALELYLGETGDFGILKQDVTGVKNETYTVFDRFCRAMDWLLTACDERGLSYLAQGDWCDPMNMAGIKGKGVSGWLTVATAYAASLWADICDEVGQIDLAAHFRNGVTRFNASANEHLWDGEWYARGITDDNVKFGVAADKEGRIWLNPQAWSILGGAASREQIAKMLPQVERQLGTPYGAAMFAPPYSGMRDDVGRVTQKFPGNGENGSVYNHASVFYIHSLYHIGEADRAYALLRQMIPGPSDADYIQRGQMPIFIPNYYRGAYHEYPRTAGRSSQLFNTGTVSWAYRSFIEGLCGLQGDKDGLKVNPQLPSHWEGIKVTRMFRGATLVFDMRRADVETVTVSLGKEVLPEARVTGFKEGETLELSVAVPRAQ
ncbi:glycoside hydrolase family 94 protein [Emericellopsis atlantica]|uniref:Glycoside hydrolase family 94 protein n=1 Tax=Emericellopsis atlantica TaxID=2614577 RepID=A0A9P8CRJ1_9HYPO|nr:glycoside hydrolase family 94 protein [Emericellopsis atlantica]KAG9257084.1 glycoside hydrolase family 94 protein [Emericellopsis atlantica]